jgi:probable rRNA maturation factor
MTRSRSAVPAASIPRAAERHAITVSCDRVRTPVSTVRLAELARRVLKAEDVPRATLSITLVGSRSMARLNQQHLAHRGPTDVITFALGDDGSGALVADIYICPEVARQQAKTWGVGVREEVARLVVHGTLHACGWDHPVDGARESSEMWKRQERLLARWLASSARTA